MLAQPFPHGPLSTVGFLVFTVGWFVATICWLWMLWDCLTAGRVAARAKIVWVVVLLCTYIVGAAVYFVTVRLARPRPPRI